LKLRDNYFSLAWDPRLTQQKLQSEQDKQIWTPATVPVSRDPYLVHYSVMQLAEEFSWIWLFTDIQQPLRLRTMAGILDKDPNLDPIRAALPPQSSVTILVDPRWFVGVEGIQEVWIGFDHKRYHADRILRQCPEMILPLEEFKDLCRR
jgi:hypothetical protein